MRAAVSWRFFMIGVVGLLPIGCNAGDPGTTDDPPACVETTPIDETCAKEIVRSYVASRYPAQTWIKFEAKYDEQDQVWVAYAEHAPDTPGNWIALHLSRDGKVLRMTPGQ